MLYSLVTSTELRKAQPSLENAEVARDSPYRLHCLWRYQGGHCNPRDVSPGQEIKDIQRERSRGQGGSSGGCTS